MMVNLSIGLNGQILPVYKKEDKKNSVEIEGPLPHKALVKTRHLF